MRRKAVEHGIVSRMANDAAERIEKAIRALGKKIDSNTIKVNILMGLALSVLTAIAVKWVWE